MNAIDVHTHFLPEGMIRELRSGRSWHGWSAETGESGRQVLRSVAGVAPFPLSMADEPWPERIRRRSQAAIHVQAIMLPTFLWSYHLSGDEAVAFCQDVNDEVADIARRHPDAVVPMGVLPLQHPARAIEEIDRAVRELGITVFSIGSHVEGRNLDDPDVAAVLDEVFRADAGVMIHASYFDRAGEHRMTRYDFGNSIGVPLEASLATMSMIYSGLLDRHPAARVGVCHGGGWVPYGIGRLWLRYTQGRDGGRLQASPAEYLRKLYYDCLIHDDLSLELLVRRVGASQVMIGTDHPYQGDMPGGSVEWIRSSSALSAEDKEAILYRNAERFLGRAAE